MKTLQLEMDQWTVKGAQEEMNTQGESNTSGSNNNTNGSNVDGIKKCHYCIKSISCRQYYLPAYLSPA